MRSDPNVVQHYLEIYPEPFTISFDPNSYVIPPPPFPHEKSTSQPGDRCFRKYNHSICYKSNVSGTIHAVLLLFYSSLQSLFPVISTDTFPCGMYQHPKHEIYMFHPVCASLHHHTGTQNNHPRPKQPFQSGSTPRTTEDHHPLEHRRTVFHLPE